MLSDKLPKRQRFLFKLIFEEGLRQSQIAHLMKLKPNAVHQLKHRMINNMIKFAGEKHLLGVRSFQKGRRIAVHDGESDEQGYGYEQRQQSCH